MILVIFVDLVVRLSVLRSTTTVVPFLRVLYVNFVGVLYVKGVRVLKVPLQ
jgi:hypothetical protein